MPRAATERPEAPSLRQEPERLLTGRLTALGLRRFNRIVTHDNRTVMVSVPRPGVLRIHHGYALAPDRVLKAVIRFVHPGTAPALRRVAEQVILSYPIAVGGRPRVRRERPRPGDEAILDRLGSIHRRLNNLWFGGALRPISFRLSGRMKTRLGEVTLSGGKPVEIAVSRRHLRRDGWQEVEQTVLHEMVHQWQAELGHPVDHGPRFRAKAREVGIEPRAVTEAGHRGGGAAGQGVGERRR